MHFGRQKGHAKMQLQGVATEATLQQQLICIWSICSLSLKQFAPRLCNWKMFALQYISQHAWPWHAPVDRPPFHVTIEQLQRLLCNHLTNFFPNFIYHSCSSRPVSTPSWRLLLQRSSRGNCSSGMRTPLWGVKKHCGKSRLLRESPF